MSWNSTRVLLDTLSPICLHLTTLYESVVIDWLIMRHLRIFMADCMKMCSTSVPPLRIFFVTSERRSIWHQMSSIQSVFLYVSLTCGLCSRLNRLRWLPITVLRRTSLNIVTLPEFWFNVYLHCLMWLFWVAELRVVSFVCHTHMWLCVCPMLMRRSRTSFHNTYFIVIQILELHISCS